MKWGGGKSFRIVPKRVQITCNRKRTEGWKKRDGGEKKTVQYRWPPVKRKLDRLRWEGEKAEGEKKKSRLGVPAR